MENVQSKIWHSTVRERSKICHSYWNVENYNKAKDNKGYVLHHRLETHFSNGDLRPYKCNLTVKELKALNVYYNRPPEELIFLSIHDHMSLHSIFREPYSNKGKPSYRKGTKLPEWWRLKIKESSKKIQHTSEWNSNVSKAMKNYWNTIDTDTYKVRCEQNRRAAKTLSEKPLTDKQREARRNNMLRVKKDSIKGKSAYTNGLEVHFYFENEVPPGYIKGRYIK